MNRLRAGREIFAIKGKVFYLHAPDGIGNSKLAAAAERHLRVDATHEIGARSWHCSRWRASYSGSSQVCPTRSLPKEWWRSSFTSSNPADS